MFNRLRHLLAPPELKASRTARLVAFESGGRARWTPRDYAGLAREGYLANAIVHRSVRLIAENVAACQYLVFEGAAEREAHPLAQLLTRPNPRQDGGVFFEMLVAHLLLAGNAYIEAVALGDTIRELYALRPDRMKVVPGADGWAEALRVLRRRAQRALRPARIKSAADPASDLLSSARRSLWPGADRGRGGRGRHPQFRGALEQGAARQCRAALRRAGVFRRPTTFFRRSSSTG